MPYRLPPELELAILELAAPPLANIDSLHDRIAFFIKISLVHRSLTAWAQDRLRDQFLYTYRRRSDEHERLKTRFEASGFGRDQPLRRLYLDISDLPDMEERAETARDSVSVTFEGHVDQPTSLLSASSDPRQVGISAQGQAGEAVAQYSQPADDPNWGCWDLCPMITSYSQALDTLWLRHPHEYLDIKDWPPPRLLCIDNYAFEDNGWGWFTLLPLSSETVLFLRTINLCTEGSTGGYATRHMILYGCEVTEESWYDVLNQFHHLETLVFFETEVDDLASVLIALPPSLRHVHILEYNFNVAEGRPNAPRVLPHLESFTFTSLPSPGKARRILPGEDGPKRVPLAKVQQAVESSIVAPKCTFKFIRSSRSPEDTLADALAALKLDP